MSWLSLMLAGAGSVLLAISAVGLFRLPDALARQHAATKSCTLALALILAGTALEGGQPGWWVRVGVIVLFLIWTLPVSSHMLARAAARHAYTPEELSGAHDPDQQAGGLKPAGPGAAEDGA